MSKKFLMILTDMNMGGVTTAAVNLCNCLCENGNKVDVLIMSESNCEEERFDKEINIKHLKGKDKLWSLGFSDVKKEKNFFKKIGLVLLGAFKKVVNKRSLWIRLLFGKRKRFKGYDAVLAYRQCSPCYYFALNCVEAKKKAAFVHGDINFMGDISTWKKYLLEFDAVAYVSNAVKEGFIKEYPELKKNAVTIYNVFNIDYISQKAKEAINEKFDKNIINFVTVSRIDPIFKGTDRIPEVCFRLKEKYFRKFHWYIVGGGAKLDDCCEKAKELGVLDHLTFVGEKNNPYAYLAKADVSIFTTKTEAFPMVVGESLILGTPMVSTRYPAIEEIIVNGENGIIAEQSVESVFEKTAMILEDKKLFNKLKENCVAFQYDNNRSYKQLMEALFE